MIWDAEGFATIDVCAITCGDIGAVKPNVEKAIALTLYSIAGFGDFKRRKLMLRWRMGIQNDFNEKSKKLGAT